MKRASFQSTGKAIRTLNAYPLWREHALPLLLYSILSLGLTWPLIRHFSTALPGTWNDVHQSVWMMWHVKEAILGRQELIDLTLLYYPHGASILASVPGLLIGIIALPFWFWGAEAAYNGSVLLGFVLTAYFMFRLSRFWKLSLPSAFFAGLILLAAPMHLAGMQGHYTKVFLGLLPLALLCFHHAIDLEAPRRRMIFWTAATAVVLLMTALFDGLQLILAAISLLFFSLAALIQAPKTKRNDLAMRIVLIGGVSILLLAPLLLATAKVIADPTIAFGRNFESYLYQPDLMEFLLPWTESLLMGEGVLRFLQEYNIYPSIETAVSIPWLALGLALLAIIKVRRRALVWGLFTSLFILLALGPSLKILGKNSFTEYGLPVILPYSFFTALPGMDFLRTPGRMMVTAYMGLAMTAGYGLDYLLSRFPRRLKAMIAGLTILLLVGLWPREWDQMQLRAVPSFYDEIALDEAVYGVLDLPITPVEGHPADMYSAYYQMYQMIHKKGIASGYITRGYSEHPVVPCVIPVSDNGEDLFLDGRQAGCYQNSLYDLAKNGYRYIVIHKPSPEYELYVPGSWGEQEAQRYIDTFFSDQTPLVEDSLATVYEVPDLSSFEKNAMIQLGTNWYAMERSDESHWRWAQSPASIEIVSPISQDACLELTARYIYDPNSTTFFGDEGQLKIESGGDLQEPVTIIPDGTVQIPISLQKGSNEVNLSLEAGNFQPGQSGDTDMRWLSFAIDRINLVIGARCKPEK